MKLKKMDISFLRSKVAKRFFFMFIGCVLIPLTVLMLISYNHVMQQLKEQCQLRIQKAAKTHGISIYEKILSLDGDLDFFAHVLSEKSASPNLTDQDPFIQRIHERIESLAFLTPTGETQYFFNDLNESFGLEGNPYELVTDKTSLIFQMQGTHPPRVYMLKHVENSHQGKGLFVAQLNAGFLFGVGHENILPPMTDLCILDQARNVVTSSFHVPDELLQNISFNDNDNRYRQMEYSEAKEDYITSYWPLFLKARFNSPNLIVLLRQAKSDILKPMEDFKHIFPFVVLLALWVIILLSSIYIRTTLEPLEKLKKATNRIANGDLCQPITITSGDEFEVLAHSFNSMRNQLDRQFKTLLTLSEIGQAILSSLHKRHIIETTLVRMKHFFACDAISIILFLERNFLLAYCYKLTEDPGQTVQEEMVEVFPEEKDFLINNPCHILLESKNQFPYFYKNQSELHSLLLLPIFVNEDLTGMVTLGYKDQKNHAKDDVNHARQMADLLAIALTNAALIEKLEEIGWGTLEALARTIDAKSPWTAGHSERVTELAVKIARLMKCSDQQIETLQRAALIHDIGKIGIDQSILDKPAKLNKLEYSAVQEHPIIGARILEPIKAFADVLPIVLQHHECYDGTGYPHGISGEDILLEARILSVADVYDALISQRPYRRGWVRSKVIELMKEESGKKFDPPVVEAFLVAIS